MTAAAVPGPWRAAPDNGRLVAAAAVLAALATAGPMLLLGTALYVVLAAGALAAAALVLFSPRRTLAVLLVATAALPVHFLDAARLPLGLRPWEIILLAGGLFALIDLAAFDRWRLRRTSADGPGGRLPGAGPALGGGRPLARQRGGPAQPALPHLLRRVLPGPVRGAPRRRGPALRAPRGARRRGGERRVPAGVPGRRRPGRGGALRPRQPPPGDRAARGHAHAGQRLRPRSPPLGPAAAARPVPVHRPRLRHHPRARHVGRLRPRPAGDGLALAPVPAGGPAPRLEGGPAGGGGGGRPGPLGPRLPAPHRGRHLGPRRGALPHLPRRDP